MANLIVKLSHNNDEIRRFTAATPLTWAALARRVSELFNLGAAPFKLSYVDDEGDRVTMSSDDELAEAVGLALASTPAVLRVAVAVGDTPKKASLSEAANQTTSQPTASAANQTQGLPTADVGTGADSAMPDAPADDVSAFLNSLASQLPGLLHTLPESVRELLPRAELDFAATIAANQVANGVNHVASAAQSVASAAQSVASAAQQAATQAAHQAHQAAHQAAHAAAVAAGEADPQSNNNNNGNDGGGGNNANGNTHSSSYSYSYPSANQSTGNANANANHHGNNQNANNNNHGHGSSYSFSFSSSAPPAEGAEADVALGYHPGVTCDKTGMSPIEGNRYHLAGHDYDLCQAEFDKLSLKEQAHFTLIPPCTFRKANNQPKANHHNQGPPGNHNHNNTQSQSQSQSQSQGQGQAQGQGQGAKFDAHELGVHPGVVCDRSGMSPLVGVRYHLRGHNYDLCQAEYDKLSPADKNLYVAIPPSAHHHTHHHHQPHGWGGGGGGGCWRRGGGGGGAWAHSGPGRHSGYSTSGPGFAATASAAGHAAASAAAAGINAGMAAAGLHPHMGGGMGPGAQMGAGPHPHNMGPGCAGGGGGKLAARFVRDVTIFDGTQMAPFTPFTKIWRIKNIGEVPWPPGTKILFVGGDQMTNELSVPISRPGPVFPDEEVDVAVDLRAPEQLGRYLGYWRLVGPHGRRKFGQRVWVHIQVVDPSHPPEVLDAAAAEMEAKRAQMQTHLESSDPGGDAPAADGGDAPMPDAPTDKTTTDQGPTKMSDQDLIKNNNPPALFSAGSNTHDNTTNNNLSEAAPFGVASSNTNDNSTSGSPAVASPRHKADAAIAIAATIVEPPNPSAPAPPSEPPVTSSPSIISTDGSNGGKGATADGKGATAALRGTADAVGTNDVDSSLSDNLGVLSDNLGVLSGSDDLGVLSGDESDDAVVVTEGMLLEAINGSNTINGPPPLDADSSSPAEAGGEYGSLLADLNAMGFTDKALNTRLIKEHNGDITATVKALVEDAN